MLFLTQVWIIGYEIGTQMLIGCYFVWIAWGFFGPATKDFQWDSAVEVSFLTRFSGSKAPMPTLIIYVRMLGVCATPACVMCCYVYWAGLDVGWSPMTKTYVVCLWSLFVLAWLCDIYCMCIVGEAQWQARPENNKSVNRAGHDVGQGPSMWLIMYSMG